MQRWSNLTMDCMKRLKNLFKGSQHQVGLVQRKELLQVWLVFLGHCLYACIHPPVQETVHGPGFLWDAPRVRLGEGLHWWRGEYFQILHLDVHCTVIQKFWVSWVQITVPLDNCYIHNPDQNPDQRCPFSGRPVANATLTVVTSPSSSQNWSTDGSGRPTRSIYEDKKKQQSY